MRSAALALAVVLAAAATACTTPIPTRGGISVSGTRSTPAASTTPEQQAPATPGSPGAPVVTFASVSPRASSSPVGLASPTPKASAHTGSPLPPGTFPAGTPLPPPNSPPPTGLTADDGITVTGGSLLVEVTDGTGAAVPNALISVYGPTLGVTGANSSGKARLDPLMPGTSYRVVVSAAGHVTTAAEAVKIEKDATTTLDVPMKDATSVSGRVTAGGAPVPGAVISTGDAAALTDADGKYTLAGLDPAAHSVQLRVSKPRYATSTITVSVGATAASVPDVALDDGSKSVYVQFDGVKPDGFAGMRARLAAGGWQLTETPPTSGGTWIVMAPHAALAPGAADQLAAFVKAGGKAILVGEWGGFSGYSPVVANTLAHALGLHFNPDLLRATGDPSGWLGASVFVPPGMGGSIQTYMGCSVFGVGAMQPIARTANTGYRVQNYTGPAAQTVVMGGPFGAGKAIVVGDTSMWSDEDTDGNGTPNLAEANNQTLLDELLAW